MKLEGYYMTVERANEALSKLKTAGFNNAHIQIDDNNGYIRRNLTNTNDYSLSNLVIDPIEMKKSPLTAVSPIINVTAGFAEFYDNNYKLVVDTDVNSMQRAKDIIKSLGGKFENERPCVGRTNEEVGELNRTFKENNI
jgi:hypothetical protein